MGCSRPRRSSVETTPSRWDAQPARYCLWVGWLAALLEPSGAQLWAVAGISLLPEFLRSSDTSRRSGCCAFLGVASLLIGSSD